MKLPTGGPNTSGAILQHYAESTGLGKTRLLETGFLALVQDRANWVYCPKCQAPVSCTLLPHVDPGADVYCRGCGEVVV